MKYSTIDEVMSGPGKEKVIEVLNENLDYLNTVKKLGYTSFGINVIGEQGEKVLYISDNRYETGEIIEIHKNPSDHRADITVRVKEQTLMEMLYNMDWIKDHTMCAALKYFPKFKFEEGTFRTVFKATRSVIKNRTYQTAY